MAGDEEAQRFLLEREALGLGPRRRVRDALGRARGRGGGVRPAEEARLPRLAVALALLPALHRRVDRRVERRAPGVGPVEAAALDEALDHAPVHAARVDAVAEVEQRAERPALAPGRQHQLDGALADVLDGGKTETNVCLDVPRGGLSAPPIPPRWRDHREVHVRLVDVGRQDLEAHLPALADVQDHLVGVRALRGQQRREEVRRMVRLQVGRLVREPRVGRRVRLVEAVPGELLHLVPDLAGLLLVHAARGAALQELVHLGGHHLDLLLAHRLAQDVGLAEREAGERRGDLHHLLLVDHDAVGLFQDRLERRVLVGDARLAVPALDEVVDHLHRPGTVERVERRQVLEAVGLEALQDVAHAVRLELEEPARLARREQLVGAGVVDRDRGGIDHGPGLRLDHLHAVVDQSERAQAPGSPSSGARSARRPSCRTAS
jgi:hypothetical protein